MSVVMSPLKGWEYYRQQCVSMMLRHYFIGSNKVYNYVLIRRCLENVWMLITK